MAMDRFGVWSPHRDSNSVRSLKAALSFRPEPWQWYDDRQQASWWVIDGTLTTLSSLSDALLQQKKNGPVEAMLLAPSWSHIEDPVWTFFKIPLNIKLVYGWIDLRLQQDFPAAAERAPPAGERAPVAILAGRQLKLKRWPNLPHYTAHGNPADAVSITLACAKLLEDWTSYEEAAGIASNTALFSVILADAQIHGILEISAPEPVKKSIQPPSPPPTRSPEKTDAWSLVKRLLRKLT
jgi:hypothetical protein